MATIVIFSPHNDDHAFALGGTIAKAYASGDDVQTIIGSFGEMSHPHYKPEVIRKLRVREAQKADRILGGPGRVQFLGLREFNFPEDFARKGYEQSLLRKLRRLKPAKVYLPCPNDNHPDHKAFTAVLLPVLRKLKTEIYGYYVYPVLHRNEGPRLLNDVSGHYRNKLSAINAFGTQVGFTHAFTNNLVYLFTIFKNGLAGFLHRASFMEVCYRL